MVTLQIAYAMSDIMHFKYFLMIIPNTLIFIMVTFTLQKCRNPGKSLRDQIGKVEAFVKVCFFLKRDQSHGYNINDSLFKRDVILSGQFLVVKMN